MIRSGGFTLVELLIVVLIISVLAAIGYPAYQNQVEEGRLSEGRAALTQFASELERCYSRYGQYNDDTNCDAYSDASSDNYYSETGIYKITVDDNAQSFTATAEREEFTGSNECGDLTIDQTGRKGVTSGASRSVDECW